MFGYLKIDKPELLVSEYETYNAVYCGLCKQLGKDYSPLMRLTLSYDCTFYTMVLMAINSSCENFKKGHCTCNLLKKCNFAIDNGNAYIKASAFSTILAYYKVIDNIEDSGFFKALIYKIIKPFFAINRNKAKKNFLEMDKIVGEMMKLQFEAEHEENCSLDKLAHPTGNMLARIFSLEAKNDDEKLVYSEFGYHLGRWIYFMDAVDDLEKDIKNNNFNPFKQKNDLQFIKFTLNQSLARAYSAYNLIEFNDFRGILDNMMLKGFPKQQNMVIAKFEKSNIKE